MYIIRHLSTFKIHGTTKLIQYNQNTQKSYSKSYEKIVITAKLCTLSYACTNTDIQNKLEGWRHDTM